MADVEKNRPSIQLASEPVPSSSSPTRDRRLSSSSVDSLKKQTSASTSSPYGVTQNVLLSNDDDDDVYPSTFRKPGKVGSILLPALAALILAWWISSLVLPLSRSRWIVQSLWAWFFLLTILFRFLPATLISRPISSLWSIAVNAPLATLPARARLALAWLATLAITFGSAFGFERPEGTAIADRVISLLGVFVFQLAIYGLSHNRKAINWIRIPVSIILQQALLLFVFKSSAGLSIFTWINIAVADFMTCPLEATAFIFDAEIAGKAWFFVSTLAPMIFLAGWVYMLYFFNWMQWLTKQFAWLGQRVFNASGAETFVALWSPWFGQANSAILIGPYIESMTDAEIGAVMATSMSSISSLLIASYTKLGLPSRSLLAQSVMVIPGSIINAKIAFPDAPAAGEGTEEEATTTTDGKKVCEPVTRSRESTHANRKKLNLRKAHDLLDSLSDGAYVGLRVAGAVLANFFVILALLLVVNGLLVWIFRGFGVRALDLHQVIAGPLYPLVFFLGVPRHEIFGLAYVLSGKLLVGSDFAYASVGKIMAGPEGMRFSERGFSVMVFALANTANLGSLGVQVGVMTALAPSRKTVIAHSGIPALLVATVTTLQTAAIAASVL